VLGVHDQKRSFVVVVEEAAVAVGQRAQVRLGDARLDVEPAPLADSYSRFFYHYDEAPLLIVNTEHLNPIDRDEDFAMLVRQLVELRGRRSFFSLGD